MFRRILTALALLVAVPNAFAQSPIFDDATYADFGAARLLDPIGDMTADRGASVTEYGPDDLEALGARDAAEALDLLVGGFVNVGDTRDGRLEREIRLRGRDPRALRVFVDGVPVDHGRFGTSDLSRIALAHIALIRVSTGPVSARYGASADAGVVEILTRQVRDRFSTRFEAAGGTGRAMLYSLWLGDTAGAFNYYGAASHDEAGSFLLPASFDELPDEAGGERENSDIRRDNFYGRAGAIVTDVFSIFTGGSYEQDEAGIPIELTRATNETDRIGHRRRVTGRMHILTKPARVFELRGLAYVSEDAERLDRFADRDAQSEFREFHDRDLRFGARLAPTLDFGPWSRVRLTGEWRTDDAEQWRQGFDRAEFGREHLLAAIEDDVRPHPKVAISAGVAYESVSADFDESDESPDTLSLVGPRGSVIVGPFAGVDVYASAALKGRFPTLVEQFDGENGNLDLEPEQTTQVEIGSRYGGSTKVGGSLAIFGSETTEVIRASYDDLAFEFGRLENGGTITTGGATAALHARPIERLYARAAYTFAASKYEPDLPGLEDVIDPLFAPAHDADLLVSYRLEMGLGAAIGWSHVSSRADSVLGDVDPLPFYSLLHARISYNYRDNMELWIAGQNATDVYYELERHQPMAGRFIHGGIRLMY